MSGAIRTSVVHANGASPHAEERFLIEEAPLTIDIQGADKFTIMRTPGGDAELVAGFLFTEAVIDSISEIVHMTPCATDANRYRVKLDGPARRNFRRNLAVNSACGFCGRDGVQDLVTSLKRPGTEFIINRDSLALVPDRLRARQPLFALTGGSHAAALIDGAGELELVREDLGRHNALDKVIGAALLGGSTMHDKGVFLSGRASLEMILKSARAGIGFVASVSAPSSLAVEAARGLGMTLCGFVRGGEVTVYCGECPGSVTPSPSLPFSHE